MKRLRLFIGNRLEQLVQRLARAVERPLESALATEVVVVQSAGMARWVSMELGRRLGVWANCRFPFPNAFLEAVFRAVLGERGLGVGGFLGNADSIAQRQTDPLFDPEVMTWRLAKLLPDESICSDRTVLERYLRDDDSGLKRYQLAARLADTFDQYTIFRPDMVLGWDRGQDRDWQADLWRNLADTPDCRHRAKVREECLMRLRSGSFRPERLPSRVSIFGIPALPRFHLDVLEVLSRHIEVNVFLMSPCRPSRGEQGRLAKRIADRATAGAPGELLIESLGKLGLEFLTMMRELHCREEDFFEEPGDETLLAMIQSELLSAHGGDTDASPRRVVRARDDSLQVHSCHSPLREVEALRDSLVALLDRHEDLEPRDIVVMTPDIEAYAPCVDAVFGSSDGYELRIPYGLADRSALTACPLVEAFLAVLDLPVSRLGAPDVMGLLETPAVQRRFELEPHEIELVRSWVERCGIRWGIDADDRRRHGLPTFSENTWQAGRDRLLLGYALPGDGENLFAGVLPFDDVEGGLAAALGKLVEFTEELFSVVRSLSSPRPLMEWADALSALLDRLFLPGEDEEREAQLLRERVRDLAEKQAASRFHEPLGLNVVREHLRSTLLKERLSAGFLGRGVTFCTLLPMRSLPFRVVCLLGMNDGAFPRPNRKLGFDLMAKAPRRGDRSLRLEDRHLFLEALLSAREYLRISYVGRSMADNGSCPPSVLVSELLDTIDQGFEIEAVSDTRTLREHLVIEHRLQAFNPAYFSGGDRLFSFSEENLRASRRLAIPHDPPRTFLDQDLPEPPPALRDVELETLCRFFTNPTRFLLKERLQVQIQDAPPELDDVEPLTLESLPKYQLEQVLVTKALAGEEPEALYEVAKASGSLPHGVVGESCFADSVNGVRAFLRQAEPLMGGARLEAVRLVVDLAEFRVRGAIEDLWAEGLLLLRYAKVKAKDRLRGWIHHLALCAAGKQELPAKTTVLGADSSFVYQPLSPNRSRRLLGALLEHYWSGLLRPLPFFPTVSLAYVEDHRKGKDGAVIRRRLDSAWCGDRARGHRGEKDDPYVSLCYGSTLPHTSNAFRSVATSIYEPMLENESGAKR